MKTQKSWFIMCIFTILTMEGCASMAKNVPTEAPTPPTNKAETKSEEFFVQDGQAKLWNVAVVEQAGKKTALDLSKKHQFDPAVQRVMFLFKIIGDGRTVCVQRFINGQPGQEHQIQIGPGETVEFGVLGPMIPGTTSMQVKLTLVDLSGDPKKDKYLKTRILTYQVK